MDYFSWLCMIAVPDGYKRVDYAKLLVTLMDTEFYWVIPRDENRAADGLELRDIFEDQTGEVCDADGHCSVLEMLVALSIRCNDELMYDPDDPKRADKWFWMMIENLGLDIFVDKKFDKTAILAILDDFMAKNGQKWLFPISKTATNFQKMELWYQLNHYLMWRFGGNFN